MTNDWWMWSDSNDCEMARNLREGCAPSLSVSRHYIHPSNLVVPLDRGSECSVVRPPCTLSPGGVWQCLTKETCAPCLLGLGIPVFLVLVERTRRLDESTTRHTWWEAASSGVVRRSNSFGNCEKKQLLRALWEEAIPSGVVRRSNSFGNCEKKQFLCGITVYILPWSCELICHVV